MTTQKSSYTSLLRKMIRLKLWLVKMGTAIGVTMGITTGPGSTITGLIGGVIFGAAGYLGADWEADFIYEN